MSSQYPVSEGQTVILKCTVIAANPNTILQWIWYKPNKSITNLSKENTYVIINITRNESGSYRCAAQNSVGTSENATVLVDVQCKYCQVRMFESCNDLKLT